MLRQFFQEWCKWSIGMGPSDSNKKQVKPENPEHLQNFFCVASRASSDHLAYRRNLVMLLDMSMTIGEHDLALDLGKFKDQLMNPKRRVRLSLIHSFVLAAGEILESRDLLFDQANSKRVLLCLRRIGMGALALAQNYSVQQDSGFRKLKRVLRLFHQMSTSDSPSCRTSLTVANELYTFLQEWKHLTGSNGDDSAMLNLIDFIINESAPGDVLRALVLWSSSNEVGDSLFPRLDTLLRRGVHTALRSELSGSLLRLKHARLNYTDENKPALSSERSQVARTTSGIWRQMAVGDLSVDK
jgi:hypothetical protein